MLGEIISGLSRNLAHETRKRRETPQQRAECVKLCQEIGSMAKVVLFPAETIRTTPEEGEVWKEKGDTVTLPTGTDATVIVSSSSVSLEKPDTTFVVTVADRSRERYLSIRGNGDGAQVFIKEKVGGLTVNGRVTLQEALIFNQAVHSLKEKQESKKTP